jgi:nucleotide-binding universal stress UspA family protein
MYTNILIPTDGSQLAGKAVQHGIALAERIGAKVTVLTVLPPFHVFTTDTQMIEDTPAQHQARMQQHAEKTLAAVADAVQAAGVACEMVHIEHEHPYQAIIDTAEAATLSSWPRTAAMASPRSSLAARRSKCSRIPRSRYWSIAESRGDSMARVHCVCSCRGHGGVADGFQPGFFRMCRAACLRHVLRHLVGRRAPGNPLTS